MERITQPQQKTMTGSGRDPLQTVVADCDRGLSSASFCTRSVHDCIYRVKEVDESCESGAYERSHAGSLALLKHMGILWRKRPCEGRGEATSWRSIPQKTGRKGCSSSGLTIEAWLVLVGVVQHNPIADGRVHSAACRPRWCRSICSSKDRGEG